MLKDNHVHSLATTTTVAAVEPSQHVEGRLSPLADSTDQFTESKSDRQSKLGGSPAAVDILPCSCENVETVSSDDKDFGTTTSTNFRQNETTDLSNAPSSSDDMDLCSEELAPSTQGPKQSNDEIFVRMNDGVAYDTISNQTSCCGNLDIKGTQSSSSLPVSIATKVKFGKADPSTEMKVAHTALVLPKSPQETVLSKPLQEAVLSKPEVALAADLPIDTSDSLGAKTMDNTALMKVPDHSHGGNDGSHESRETECPFVVTCNGGWPCRPSRVPSRDRQAACDVRQKAWSATVQLLV